MSNIPNNINKEHIISAIQEIENKGISNSRRKATEYSLFYNNKEYPPKYVISIANKYANDEELNSNDFNSIQSRTFLTNLGFDCIKKSGSLKRDFAKWLLKNGANSYKDYYGNSIDEIEIKLDEINSFFESRDLYKLNNSDSEELKNFLQENIYGVNRESNIDFFEYDKIKGNGRPKAIIGKKNYFVFLDEINSINNKNIENRLKQSLTITHKMEFFTHREFELLNKYKGVRSDRTNKDLDNTYTELKKAYKKLEYWLNNIQKNVFPNGGKHILKKPTNQANNFDGYLWAKLYPSKKDEKDKWLAITLGLDDDFHFNVKIDTVGLSNNSELLNKYLNYRGDFLKSKIVKRHKSESFNNWEDLILQTVKDIDFLMDFYPEIKKLNDSSSNETSTMKDLKIPKNQILYGPPGTGKTYKTKELAVQISNPNFIYDTNWSITERREEIVKEYDRLCEKGQIVFTTFHQSMNYEDFVEGIKPKTENEKVTYEVEDGIFKEISLKASQKTISNFKDAYNQLLKEFSDNDNDFLILKTPKEKEFRVRLNSNNNLSLFTTNKSSQQGTFTKEKLEQHLYHENAFNGWEGYANAILNYLKENFKLSNKGINHRNYTLIIDEINRGNVSAVFGELITLLEDDKRIGQKEAIKITLPYSKDEFGVPSNLYIIGTMNTADRSVEALDTALRRRFSFTEVVPKPKLLSDLWYNIVNLELLLKTINDRIELLIDKDHKIGHSYFMNIRNLNDLKQTFKNKVIPLLEEYFFGDYGKIGLVLGDGFIKLKDDEDKISFAKNFTEKYEDAENLREKAVYTFTDEDSWDKNTFISIYEQ
jgi:5-methylcytosine-specific restriction protein B